MQSVRVLTVVIGLMTALPAQDTGHADRSAKICADSDVVLINASVTDRRGGVVTGLAASQFRLFEDGKIQDVKYCGSEDAPVSIGLVLDSSRSMGGNLAALKKAAIRFVRAANPVDEYLLVGFRDRPKVVVPFTSDTDRLIASVERLQVQGHTALLDAVRLAVSEMRHASLSRKALILISDGADNYSRYTERETRRLIAEVGFPVYTMCLCAGPRGNRYAMQRPDSDILESISRPTGGRHFRSADPKKLISIAELVSAQIRHEYILGYVSSNRRNDGGFRRVRVTVESSAGPKLRVSHRAGYFAPVQ